MIKTLLLLLQAGKLGKVMLTGGTMLLSVIAYSLVFGWRYAIGFVGLIFVHEMGHYIAARQRGLDVGAPTFIPFVGAWIAAQAPAARRRDRSLRRPRRPAGWERRRRWRATSSRAATTPTGCWRWRTRASFSTCST